MKYLHNVFTNLNRLLDHQNVISYHVFTKASAGVTQEVPEGTVLVSNLPKRGVVWILKK